jgi:imidazolonepropionase-like amidohydrolase
MTFFAACAAAWLGAGGALAIEPLREGETGLIVRCGKVLTMDGSDRVLAPGVVVVRNEKIEAVAEDCSEVEGFTILELERGWALPGMVDLHTHIHSGSWRDINDSVFLTNPELRVTPAMRPGNPDIQRARAGGVTTLFGIPGSGSSISGFGALYKAKSSESYHDVVLRDPGGMKVAQTHNPQRSNGDMGQTWCGLSWMLEEVNARALEQEDRRNPRLEPLRRVHRGELPVLIHCAGVEGVASAVRMWKGRYGTRCVVSHGCFDGWMAADFVASMGVPVNHGPRTLDYLHTQEGRVVATAAEYLRAGVPQFSLNTDSRVVPQEEFFLQGSVSARLGADSYQMLRALTIHPAQSFGIDDRVGSLEPGKDADLVITSGDPLDPRSRVELVVIDGRIEYDRERDGQTF